jgi:hypothetical protein
LDEWLDLTGLSVLVEDVLEPFAVGGLVALGVKGKPVLTLLFVTGFDIISDEHHHVERDSGLRVRLNGYGTRDAHVFRHVAVLLTVGLRANA